jgi:ankyrin repeat protein
MIAASNQAAMERFKRAKALVFKENKQAFDAVVINNVSKMEKIFKTGGIKQEAIDCLIFWARSVKMLRLFLRYGGDMHKLGPPLHPNPRSLLFSCTACLRKHAADSIERRDLVKLIKFLIEEGADVNAVDCLGFTPFINCATEGEKELCKMLVDRGAVPSTERNDGTTALHMATQMGNMVVCRYLVEDCGLDINAESRDENMRPRTPLFLAALKGNIKVCSYLLEKGSRVDGGEGLQPLIGAAEVYSFIRSFF